MRIEPGDADEPGTMSGESDFEAVRQKPLHQVFDLPQGTALQPRFVAECVAFNIVRSEKHGDVVRAGAGEIVGEKDIVEPQEIDVFAD